MAWFGAFGDDSGSHEQSPIMILAVVVGEHKRWEMFSDEWWYVLNHNPPLQPHKGHIYFSSSDAETLNGCFKGVSRKDADDKVDLLTEIVLSHMDYAMLSGIKWEHFKQVFQAGVPKTPSGRLHNYFKHPYYMCFHDVVACVLQKQWAEKLGEVDFVFDEQGKMLGRSIEIFKKARTDRAFSPELRNIAQASQIIPGDDKLVLPLQAADLVAWQSRNRSWPHTGRVTSSAKKLVASRKVFYHAINRGELRLTAKWLNYSPATLRMLQRSGWTPIQIVQRAGERKKN
ncbi:MAG TPA: hypothetical protein DC054_09795 [Blastocatellia bacterium]|nr:hypothetical protein [Blastocatellia bacterium]